MSAAHNHSLRTEGGDWRVSIIALGAVAAGLCAVGAMIATDLRRQILPDSLNALLGAAGLAFHGATAWRFATPIELLLGACVGAGALLFLRWVYLRFRGIEALGLGDVKFMVAAGLWVGVWNVAWLLAIASLGTLLTVLCLRAFAGAPRAATTRYPFGPGLCIALVLVCAELTGVLP
jgi:leader peptidase (prepilin peptidase) / N-methyltransferase